MTQEYAKQELQVFMAQCRRYMDKENSQQSFLCGACSRSP